MIPKTHIGIDHALCGTPVEIREDYATVRFEALPQMAADGTGLVHGGFIFGLADHAAMLAVNHPNVVLGAADVRFLAPVKVGDEVLASAQVAVSEGKKRVIAVSASVDEVEVLRGTLTAFVLDNHVLT